MGRKGKTRKGMQQKEKTKGRYLCVSNGFEIWCLDLKKSEQRKGPVPLPKFAVLNLVGKDLPASVGLFKLGSDVYMIGGQQLPFYLKEAMDFDSICTWGEFPSSLSIYDYKILCNSWGIEGSSRVIYHLEKDGSTLSVSKSRIIKDLNHPKVWPIVEQINGQLHVVESVSYYLTGRRVWKFSHEVCSNPNSDSDGSGWDWEDVITTTEAVHIHSHVVVGDRIYVAAYDESNMILYFEFESETKIWKRCPIEPERCLPSEMRRVWHTLATGTARSVGEFPCGGQERVFVVVAIHGRYDIPLVCAAQAVAYLVTLTGQVICYQLLPNFFKKSLFPCNLLGGAIFEVEEDEEGPARTFCSVVSGILVQAGRRLEKDYVCVNTFSVEMLSCVGVKVREILEKKACKEEVDLPVPLEFVRVTHKDKFVYETNTDLTVGSGDFEGRFVGWRACFL